MELSILTTARCNASCAHCSTNCGPFRTESLTREQIFSLMDQAAELSTKRRPEFYFSGGEAFLDFELLLEIVAHGKKLGALVTCVTNGYWATSPEKAQAMLKAVNDAGLHELAVSSSRFHEEFVSRKRVERVLNAARAVGLPCTVKHVTSRSDCGTRREVSSWAKAAGATGVQELPLMPYLRDGAQVEETEYIRKRGLPRGVCPARLLSIKENGEAFTCCTPGGFTPMLALGSVHKESLKDIRERFYLGGTQQILRKQGPIRFAKAIQAKGLAGRLRTAYLDPCDLCTRIASDPAMAAVAAETAEAFEVRQLQRLLKSMTKARSPRARARPSTNVNPHVVSE